MSFIVTARMSAREIRFERGSMLAALEQALMLMSSGMESVRIVDSRGRSHTPADLSRALLDGRDAKAASPSNVDTLAA